MDSFLQKPAQQIAPVRAWATINDPPTTTYSYIVIESSEDSDTGSEAESLAKDYHASILQAATRLVAGRRRPTRKRRVEATTAKARKRHKSKVNQTSPYHTRVNPKTLPVGYDQSSEKGPNRVHEPVKRFLLPTKHSKLNAVPKIALKSTNRLTVTSEVTLDIENDSALHQAPKDHPIDSCAHKETSALLSHSVPAQTSPIIEKQAAICETMEGIESLKLGEGLDVDMDVDSYMGTDADIDNSYFDPLVDQVFSDIDFTYPSSSPNNTSLSSVSTTPPQSRKVDIGPDLNTHTVNAQAPSGMTAPLPPFLRTQNTDQIALAGYSPIPRLAAPLKISTCFRIAEALRILKPAHPDAAATVELYAIVADFATINNTQTVRFADLFFPQRPPYISGSGRGVGKLFLADTEAVQSRSKNTDGTICRAVIRSASPGTAGDVGSTAKEFTTINRPDAATIHAHVHVSIEAIRESDWEEIAYVRGIVDPEGVEAEKSKRREYHAASSAHVLGVM